MTQSQEQDAAERYSIREVAKRFGVQPSTLRYYEDAGLLDDVGRDAAGQRVYEERHIGRLEMICCFKRAGMTIAELQRFIALDADEPQHIDEILELLEARKQLLDDHIAQLERDREHIDRKLRYYGDIKTSVGNAEPLPEWRDYE